MDNFADRLEARIRAMGNPTVMGLDPMLDYVPARLRTAAAARYEDSARATGQALLAFNQALIDAVADIVPAIKPQFAYYEQYGIHGWSALAQTIAYAQAKGLLVIADAKRNDIGSTAEAYARAILGESQLADGLRHTLLGADAVTLNGYLGLDGLQPFFDLCQQAGKGVYILVRTSNPSAGDLQDLALADGRTVYEAMAGKVEQWGRTLIGSCGYSSVGAVVGATWPQQAVRLRSIMPHSLILVPGYGAQGATADDAVASFGPDGGGAIVNASRSLMLAWRKHNLDQADFAEAARLEALQMRDDLRQALVRAGKQPG